MKNTKHLLLALGAAFCLTATACQKVDEAASGLGGQTEKEVKSLELRNNWKSTCSSNSFVGSIFGIPSRTETIEFGASLSQTTNLFRDDNCQVASVRVVENGRYDLGDKVADNTFVLNMHFDSVAITPLNSEGANALDGVVACGFSDWAVGQSKDVTSQSSV